MSSRTRYAAKDWAAGAAVLVAALACFGINLEAEPDFVDEWAYVSQTYFWPELARPNNFRWLEYPSLDLPPLPKYAMGAALQASGYPLPRPEAALAWYRDTSTKFGSRAMLVTARRPSVVLGAIGCVMAYVIGTMSLGRREGLVASFLLMIDPLYRMLTRRAMSDVYAEALILTACAVGLWAWRRTLTGRRPWVLSVAVMIVSGSIGGLAVLSKLNGGLALMILAGWSLMALVLRRIPVRWRFRLQASTLLAGLAAFVTFVALNPFVTARGDGPLTPESRAISGKGVIARCGELIRHRMSVPRDQQRAFPHNALTDWSQKLSVVAVQGFGRFGPLGRKRYDATNHRSWFDSTRRYDWLQDAGAMLWLPVVLAGGVVAARRGRVQYQNGEPPAAWALLMQVAITLATVTAFLPLAWDRFFLSIQAGSCLLAGGLFVGLWDRISRPKVAG